MDGKPKYLSLPIVLKTPKVAVMEDTESWGVFVLNVITDLFKFIA